jgi:hypothetical protein
MNGPGELLGRLLIHTKVKRRLDELQLHKPKARAVVTPHEVRPRVEWRPADRVQSGSPGGAQGIIRFDGAD